MTELLDPTTLVAIDGHSLNFNLRKKAHTLQSKGKDLPENFGRPRLRLDYIKLAELLARDDPDALINYYTDQKEPSPTDLEMGKVVSFRPEDRRGFIAGAAGGHFEFSLNDVIMLKARGERQKLYKQIVSFEIDDLDENHAVNVKVVSGNSIDRYYRLRREFYFAMLEDSGYRIARCRSSRNPHHKGKAKSVDCRIYYDAMDQLSSDEDRLVLLSDDPNFGFLINGLANYGISITLATFDTDASEELRKIVEAVGGDIILLDDHLLDIQLEAEAMVV